MSKSFYQFYGYDVEVIVGSRTIQTSAKTKQFGLCDRISVTRQENTPGSATFSFIPPEASIDLGWYQGQNVIISIRTPADGWQQVFTGFVDIPSMDFIARKITLICTDDRNNQIIKLPRGIVQNIGNYDESIFGAVIDQADELDKRLQTVTSSFDFNRFGLPTVTPWKPKTTPDFTFNSVDLSQGVNPTISHTSRKTTINTINIVFKYSYQRLHQQAIKFSWPGYDDFLNDYWRAGKPSFPQKSQVSSAAQGGNWGIINPTGEENLINLWPAQGFGDGNSIVIWQPNQIIQSYAPIQTFIGYEKDSDGKFITVGEFPNQKLIPKYTIRKDSEGNTIMQVVSSSVTDTSSGLCRGAQWIAAKKFSQTVTETYNINVVAQQSVDKFGTVNQQPIYSLTSEYDTTVWEGDSPLYVVDANLYVDKAENRGELNNSLQTAYRKAVHDILSVHRDVQVGFRVRTMQPRVDLDSTCLLNLNDPKSSTAHVSAQGKTSTVTHTIDLGLEIAYTEIIMLMSRSDGSASTDYWHYNKPVQNPAYIGDPQTIVLQTHAGFDPETTPNMDQWTGWICNKEVTTITSTNGSKSTVRTNYPEEFRVDYPEIPSSLRDEIVYYSNTELNVAIPNDYIDTST